MRRKLDNFLPEWIILLVIGIRNRCAASFRNIGGDHVASIDVGHFHGLHKRGLTGRSVEGGSGNRGDVDDLRSGATVESEQRESDHERIHFEYLSFLRGATLPAPYVI